MSAGVLLDTGFLISLSSPGRPNHDIANKYYRFLLEQSLAMHISAIVVAEIAIKQKITDYPIRNFRFLPFNINHGIEAARLWNLISPRDDGDSRVSVRDDVKIMGQAAIERIPFILTEDASTLYKYCERLRGSGHWDIKAIKIQDGFDPSVFREDGQKALELSKP